MYRAQLIAVIPCLFLLTSCSQDARVQSLEAQNKDFAAKFLVLEEEIKQLKQQVSLSEMFKNFEGVAYMTPGNDGYSLIKTDFGVLTVSLNNIQPYANGSRITLQFGNLTAATIDGLKAKLEWGSLDKDGLANNQEAKSRDITFNESLQSGGWTDAQVVLEGIPPSELGFVRLRDVGHRGIKLRR